MNGVGIFLLLSLGLNFFIAGYIYSQYKAKEIKMTRLSFDNSISRLVEPFPRKSKRDFYVTMRSKRDELIPLYQDIVAKRENVMAVLTEDNLDSSKLRSALEEYHDAYHPLINSSQNVMVEVLEKLSSDERRAILERYNNPPERSDRHRSNNDGRPDNRQDGQNRDKPSSNDKMPDKDSKNWD